MPIRDLIRRPVESLSAAATCQEAARLMRDRNVGCVVVHDSDGGPLGMVTDRDLALRIVATGESGEKRLLSDVMTEDPIFVHGDRSLDDAIRVMRDGRVRRVLVVDEGGRLEGVVSLDDLLAVLAAEIGDLSETVEP